jgi:hypothetical protein
MAVMPDAAGRSPVSGGREGGLPGPASGSHIYYRITGMTRS